MDIWAFWEPESTLPAYLRLCIETWKQIPQANIHLLNYRNLWKYIDVDAYGPKLFDGSYHMAQVGDAIRAMLLEKYGGVWLDVDIMVLNPAAEKFLSPEKDIRMFGELAEKKCHISFIIAKRPGTVGMINWVAFNKNRVWNIQPHEKVTWGRLGGEFLEPYVYSNPQEVEILDWQLVHPDEQLKRVAQGQNYRQVYEDYFFLESHHLDEIQKDVVILNNTWTPAFYKNLSVDDLLRFDCTTTNLLIEILDLKCPRPSLKIFRQQ